MNVKRFVLACLAVFIFVFVFNGILHGKILASAYAQTQSLWRPQADMGMTGPYFPFLALGLFIESFAFCLIYTRSEARKQSVAFGAGYGVAVGVLKGGGSLVVYAVQPLPMSLIGAWIIGDIIQVAIAGAILGAIYRGDAVQTSVGATAPA